MSKTKDIEFPEHWHLSEVQAYVIGILCDNAGAYISAYAFCKELYDDKAEPTMPAPAKFRVTMQRCREIVEERTEGKARIESKRGSGWFMSRKSLVHLRKAVDPD